MKTNKRDCDLKAVCSANYACLNGYLPLMQTERWYLLKKERYFLRR
jgi:hypothetical protein